MTPRFAASVSQLLSAVSFIGASNDSAMIFRQSSSTSFCGTGVRVDPDPSGYGFSGIAGSASSPINSRQSLSAGLGVSRLTITNVETETITAGIAM